MCYTVWYSNRFKRCTIRECTITYTCHTVRYRYTCQLSTIVECVVADLSNPLTVYFRRNYICRTVSDIFGYFQCTVAKLMGEETSFIGKTVFEGIHMSVCILDIIYLESIDLLCFKAITIIVISKSIIVNMCHTFRNGNRLERYTVVKCTPADICHTIRYSNTCQLSTIDECAVTDPDDLLTVNFTRNINIFRITGILCNPNRTVIKHAVFKVPISLCPCAHRTDYNHCRKGCKTEQPLFHFHITFSFLSKSEYNKKGQSAPCRLYLNNRI